jgi:hypothetical protein
MKQKQISILFGVVVFTMSLVAFNVLPANRAEAARSIIFPVIGPASFTNDYNAPRPAPWHVHRAIDIMAKKGQKLVSAVDGTITRVNYPQPGWGWSITIRDNDGYRYTYIHMNDDNPGTNDGRGGPMKAYAVDMQEGNKIVKGQSMGWVGDSGHSGGISHLHFEMHDPSGNVLNPYTTLQGATRIAGPRPQPQMPNEILPYGTRYGGGISIAMGNFDGDANMEYVTAPGPGADPFIKVYDDDDTLLYNFYAYKIQFKGGVDVGTGDVDNDGIDEIVTGPLGSGGPHVKIFAPNGTQIASLFAYKPDMTLGLKVAAGDTDGDGEAEIITGVGPGGTPHVKVMEIDGTRVSSFLAYAPEFAAGLDVASADVSGSSEAEIITGAGPGAGSHVRIFNQAGAEQASLGAYPGSQAGVRVSAGNVDSSTAKAEILTVQASKGIPYIKMWAGDGNVISGMKFMEEWWQGYHDVGAGFETSKAATGFNRRASIRQGLE